MLLFYITVEFLYLNVKLVTVSRKKIIRKKNVLMFSSYSGVKGKNNKIKLNIQMA